MNSPVVTCAHLAEARDVVKSFNRAPALRGASRSALLTRGGAAGGAMEGAA
jgi:hypothetical protein